MLEQMRGCAVVQVKRTNSLNQNGFTIVELIIMIVVIAILAAITIVSYGSISRRAEAAQMKSYLQSAAKAANTHKISSPDDTYPDTIPPQAAAPASLSTQYSVNSDKTEFCITSKTSKGDEAHVTATGAVSEGSCLDSFGLVARWLFNGDMGDSRPNSISPVKFAGLVSTIGQNGQPGGAYSFSEGSFIDLGSHPKIDNLKTITMSAWMKIDPEYIAGTILSISNASNFIEAGFVGSKPVMIGLQPQGILNRDQWTHMVYTIERPAGKLWFYKNGYLLGSYATPHDNRPNPRAFIGAAGYAVNSTSIPSNSFKGSLDDIRLYDRSLSPSEVLQLYTLGAL